MRMRIGPIATALAAAGMMLVGVVIAKADSSGDARKAIQLMYQKRDAAAQKRDLKATLATAGSDFVFVSKDGQKGDIKELKKRLSTLYVMTQSLKSSSAIKKFAIKGKQAVVTSSWRLTVVAMDPQTQLPRHFEAESTSEDVWAKGPTGWLEQRMTIKQERATLDGKPLDIALSPSGKKKPVPSVK